MNIENVTYYYTYNNGYNFSDKIVLSTPYYLYDAIYYSNRGANYRYDGHSYKVHYNPSTPSNICNETRNRNK